MNKYRYRSVSTTTLAIIIIVVVIVVVVAGVAAYYATKKPVTTTFTTTTSVPTTTTTTSIVPTTVTTTFTTTTSVPTTTAPPYILIGTLYASTGRFASSSMPEYEGLQTWAKWINQSGGIYVAQYGKKIPVKIIAYDDDSDPTTAQSLYNELVTVDHVNVLVADFGSVLTAPAVSYANASHILLWDPTGSSYAFFTNNPYIIDTSIPVSAAWVTPIAQFLHSLNITKVAVIYAANDFNAYQDYLISPLFSQYGITAVLNESFPTSTSDFSSYIASIESAKPQAVIEFGYPTDDIPFLNQIASSKVCFPMIYTNYPGLMLPMMLSGVGANMNGTFTGAFPPIVEYKPTYGPNLTVFDELWSSTYPGVSVNYNVLAGFNAGLIIGLAIQDAGTLNQTAIKAAVLNDISGKVVTIDGLFNITQYGMQVGETPLPSQVWVYPNGTTNVVLLWPPNEATGKAVYPAPCPP
ncbi:MAG: ABC transporter substrate-binding protein [Caldisphaera sp.]